MKKILFSAILLLVCCSLCSCHGSEQKTEFKIPEAFDTTREFEINFWAKNDSNKTQVEIYKKAIEDFQNYYPNIKINLRTFTDYRDIYKDVLTNISTDTTPNVCVTYPDHIATYLESKDTVIPLGQLFNDEKYGLGGDEVKFDAPTKEEIIPEYLNECQLNGDFYAIPFMRSSEACYVNKTYVEKLGYTLPDTLTWDFIWEVSEAAMQKDDNGLFKVNGQSTMIPFIYKSTDNMMIQMLKQKNAGYSTNRGDIQIFNDTTEEILKTIASHSKTKSFNTFARIGYPGNYFNKGQCIFAIDSTAGATWIGSNAPLLDINKENIADFETAVMTVPQFDIEKPQMISQGPSICIFNKDDSQEVLASWLFAQFMLTDKVQVSYSQTEGYVPVTLKAQNSNEYKEYLSKCGEDTQLHYDVKIKASKLVIDNTSNTFVTPVFNGSASLRQAAGDLIEKTNLAARQNKDIDRKFFDDLYDEVSSSRLDAISISYGKVTLDKMPIASKCLIISLCAVWIGLIAYVLINKKKNKKR